MRLIYLPDLLCRDWRKLTQGGERNLRATVLDTWTPRLFGREASGSERGVERGQDLGLLDLGEEFGVDRRPGACTRSGRWGFWFASRQELLRDRYFRLA